MRRPRPCTDGVDGWVSLEVSPLLRLTHDSSANALIRHHRRLKQT
ncbi:hypothetical protein OG417_24465 [Actinoallomurus sp. NBC_01490]|nr:hypothetical protein [Actinoallomurus sp. NBC_01490]